MVGDQHDGHVVDPEDLVSRDRLLDYFEACEYRGRVAHMPHWATELRSNKME